MRLTDEQRFSIIERIIGRSEISTSRRLQEIERIVANKIYWYVPDEEGVGFTVITNAEDKEDAIAWGNKYGVENLSKIQSDLDWDFNPRRRMRVRIG